MLFFDTLEFGIVGVISIRKSDLSKRIEAKLLKMIDLRGKQVTI